MAYRTRIIHLAIRVTATCTALYCNHSDECMLAFKQCCTAKVVYSIALHSAYNAVSASAGRDEVAVSCSAQVHLAQHLLVCTLPFSMPHKD